MRRSLRVLWPLIPDKLADPNRCRDPDRVWKAEVDEGGECQGDYVRIQGKRPQQPRQYRRYFERPRLGREAQRARYGKIPERLQYRTTQVFP